MIDSSFTMRCDAVFFDRVKHTVQFNLDSLPPIIRGQFFNGVPDAIDQIVIRLFQYIT